jgi:uncharacterized spore protein YtfJ
MSMDMGTLLAQARDAVTVKRVFGEPIERDGVMVIPVANVMGGFGGGGPRTEGRVAGGGFGVRSTPAGVYVINHGRVDWRPALNVNAVILGGQIVAIVMFVTLWALVSVLTERRSTKLAGIRALTARGQPERAWMRPLARVRRS